MFPSINKKGARAKCKNDRTISLDLMVFKIYARIVEHRVRTIVERTTEEEQTAFMKGRGPTVRSSFMRNKMNEIEIGA